MEHTTIRVTKEFSEQIDVYRRDGETKQETLERLLPSSEERIEMVMRVSGDLVAVSTTRAHEYVLDSDECISARHGSKPIDEEPPDFVVEAAEALR